MQGEAGRETGDTPIAGRTAFAIDVLAKLDSLEREFAAALSASMEPFQRRSIASASTSLSKARSATPLLVVWADAPPRSSAVTSSCVTVFTTSGPVTNM